MISRNFTIVINYILDNLCPPILRDCKLIMRPIIRIAYGKYTEDVLDFKEKYPFMNQDEIDAYYEKIKDAPINRRDTDINSRCLQYILDNIEGKTILDAACGRGYLMQRIHQLYSDVVVVGTDLVLPDDADQNFIRADIRQLPFKDNSFDTVICTHALEHIREYRQAIDELVRITAKRLIIVVPRQREYKYTPDLHVNFIPYMYRFKEFINIPEGRYMEIGRDFLCVIDFK